MPRLHDELPTDIERIVDRKLIKQRVHYYVVWKGFGEENNTWESRLDLIADGYTDAIKSYEEQRKNEAETLTPRGRSPGRPSSKSPRTKSRSPGRGVGRPRTRRSRSRSVSVSRKLPMISKDDAEQQSSSSFSSTTTRQRKKSPSDTVETVAATETPGRQSARKKQQTTTETSEFVSRLEVHKSGDPMMLDEEDDSVLLRSTIAALHSIAPSTRLGIGKGRAREVSGAVVRGGRRIENAVHEALSTRK
uniref:Chromo domain-containing protein n=1 Tax=Peronospora matthiolae TaxID=2874970 RepID=A0AAV1UR93_9STRA